MSAAYSHDGRNLLLVANYASDVGYAWWLMETFWVWLAEIAAEKGLKTLLIYPKITTLPKSISSSGIDVRQLLFPTESGADTRKLERFVKENNIGTIYLTDRPYASPTYRKLREVGIHSIINHDHTPGQPTLGSLVKWIPRRLSILAGKHYCDHYIAVSEYVHRKHIIGAAIPSSRCRVVRNGIPLRDIPEDRKRQEKRASLGLTSTDLAIVNVGRADTYKGVDFLISCVKSMDGDPRFANARFLRCGAGPHLELFRQQIEKLGIGHRFRCLGHRDDIHEILSACDIAVHASPAEAGSLAILEYMGAGLPVFAPYTGANREQVLNEVTGYFYKYRDGEDLKRAIAQLSEDEILRQQIGRAGRRRVEEHFSLESMHNQFEYVFRGLLSEEQRTK